MIQKPQLFDDDSAVSPVIGVILMVAITVILAAVIATFVLGLGEQVSDTTPNANFQADFNSTSDVSGGGEIVAITHQSGDRINVGELDLGGDFNLTDTGGLLDEWAGNDDEVSAGDTLRINDSDVGGNITEGDKLQIIYDSGDTSSILRTFEAPQDYSIN